MFFDITVRAGTEAMVAKGMLGSASILIKDKKDGTTVVALNDITIRDGKNGLWPAYPQRQGGDKYYSYYFPYPENKEMKAKLDSEIIKKFNELKPADKQPATAAKKTPAAAPKVAAEPDIEEVDFS